MKKKTYFAAVLLALTWGCSNSNSTGAQDKTQSQEATSNQEAASSQQTSSSQEAPAAVSEDKTKEVLDHHWQAFIRNELEPVMADYTEESVLITPDRTYKGLKEIRGNFEAAFVKFPAKQTAFTLSKSVVDGGVAYILWQAKTPTFHLTYATDTFVIKDGKIISQTYAGVATPLKK
jgi:hypothetical protein